MLEENFIVHDDGVLEIVNLQHEGMVVIRDILVDVMHRKYPATEE